MKVAARRSRSRQRYVDGVSLQGDSLSLGCKPRGQTLDFGLYPGAELVDLTPKLGPFLWRQSADPLLFRGYKPGLSPEVLVLQRRERFCGRDFAGISKKSLSEQFEPFIHISVTGKVGTTNPA